LTDNSGHFGGGRQRSLDVHSAPWTTDNVWWWMWRGYIQWLSQWVRTGIIETQSSSMKFLNRDKFFLII